MAPITRRRRNGGARGNRRGGNSRVVRRNANRSVNEPVNEPERNDKVLELTINHNKACMFCGRKEISEKLFGPLYQLDNVVVHYFCILLSSRAVQNGEDKEGIWGFLLEDIRAELERGAKETCIYCNKPGATISCCGPKCDKIFHLPCGLKNGSMHQFFQTFKSFCIHHRITQSVDLNELQSSTPIQCPICREDVVATPLQSSIWAPCCKRNAWFHRMCIQELALSAGYFFKCPLCNNIDKFKCRMLTLGIYIPSRDASWETVPNAYSELLERPSTCNAEICLCPYPEKKNYQQESGSWEIILCHTCGSNGTHMLCSSLKCDQQWNCKSCHEFLIGHEGKSLNNAIQNAQMEVQNDFSGESSSSSCTLSSVSSTSSFQTNNNRRSMRETTKKSGSRESVRLVDNNNREPIIHRRLDPRLVNTEPIIISDEDDDDVQCIAYIDPPVIPKIKPNEPVLPIISNVTSFAQNYRNKVVVNRNIKNPTYIITECIDLTSDDETTK